MKIAFDKTALIAGIGLVPWTRLGPERWFTNYKIASLYGWDLQNLADVPEVLALSDYPGSLPHLKKFTSQHLIDTPEFQALLRNDLSGYRFLTYKPVQLPAALKSADITLVSMNRKLTATLENKVEFRKRFADLSLPIPAYTVYERAALRPDVATLKTLLNGNSSVILQDEALSGGRGTFVVATQKDLQHALESIEVLGGGKRVVVSKHIKPARERSIQGCATRYGVFIGPLQKQIIADPLLAHMAVPDGDRFCGAEISPDDPLSSLYPRIREYAERIGRRLLEVGYRGIFSVDYLIDESGDVYVLEVNPRLTGITPLLTALYREHQDIPFYLLHILETANMDYRIVDDSVSDIPPTGSLMVVHGHNSRTAAMIKAPHSGFYEGGRFLSQACRLDGSEHHLVQRYSPPGFPIKPGGRLFSVFSRQPILDDNDVLLPRAVKVVKYLQKNTNLEELAV